VKSAYLDASAIVKLVLLEAETEILHAHLGNVTATFTSEVTEVELCRAVRRATADPDRLDAAGQWLESAAAIELDARVRAEAANLAPRELGTLDAIHLASAVSVRELLDEFVTYDRQLAAAARTAGLIVVSPGDDA
jgi:predicted nucleic acid-binding protein